MSKFFQIWSRICTEHRTSPLHDSSSPKPALAALTAPLADEPASFYGGQSPLEPVSDLSSKLSAVDVKPEDVNPGDEDEPFERAEAEQDAPLDTDAIDDSPNDFGGGGDEDDREYVVSEGDQEVEGAENGAGSWEKVEQEQEQERDEGLQDSLLVPQAGAS